MRRALLQSRKHSQQAFKTMASEPLRIGLFGGGVVGGGVYTILEERKQQSFQALGAHAQIVKVCVRDLSKARSFTASAHTELVKDYDGSCRKRISIATVSMFASACCIARAQRSICSKDYLTPMIALLRSDALW
jgi:homoserine dehydrogenase